MSEFHKQPGRHVAWLLTEIEHQTTGRLSSESQLNLVNEVASHLEAGIQARMELGVERTQAEREAVELFGRPETYVNDLLAIHEIESEAPETTWWWLLGDRRTILTLWVGCACATAVLFAGQGDLHSNALSLIGVITAIVLARFSYLSIRLQLLPLALSTIGIYLVWCTVVCMRKQSFSRFDLLTELIVHTAFCVPLLFCFAGLIHLVFWRFGSLDRRPHYNRPRGRRA